EALTRRYVDRTALYLGDPRALRPRAAVRHLVAVFIRANEVEGRICLCGLLAPEGGGLPAHGSPQVAALFALVAKWLGVAVRPATTAPRAVEIVACLEGGLLISRIRQDPAILRGIVSETVKRIEE